MGNQVTKASEGMKNKMSIRRRRPPEKEFSEEEIRRKFENIPKLNDEEKKVLESSWILIRRNTRDVGMKMFLRMFESSRESQYSFTKFNYLDPEELENSDELRELGAKIMDFLDKLIAQIDNTKAMWDMTIELGKRHFSYGALPMYMDLYGPHFVIAVRGELGDYWYEAMEYHWLALFKFIIYTMKFGWNLKRAEEQEKARRRNSINNSSS